MGVTKQGIDVTTPTLFMPNMLDYLSIECYDCCFNDMSEQQFERLMEAVIRDAANNWDA